MTWIKAKGHSTVPTPPVPVRRHGSATPHVDAETERKLADFLVTHGRLVARNGRPSLHMLGTYTNHDGTKDYAVRTHVSDGGARKTFDSHIRQYETGRMRLIR